MELSTSREHLNRDTIVKELYEYLESSEKELELEDAQFYFDFPVYRDDEGEVLTSKAILVSPCHGLVLFTTLESRGNYAENIEDITQAEDKLDEVAPYIISRLIKNRNLLKKRSTDLKFKTMKVIYAPLIDGVGEEEGVYNVLTANKSIETFLKDEKKERMPQELFLEIISTIDGSKGLIKPRQRRTDALPEKSKGRLVDKLELEIAIFDKKQKEGYIPLIDGAQRIRGLAGSGKTVILAMKAAQTHLRNPSANILYTFSTKSLYQLIKRLITRFYREFADTDPDWEKIQIMHAWGGISLPGVYYSVCKNYNYNYLTFNEAIKSAGREDPFDYACNELLEDVKIEPQFDYVIVDEGQDFPKSFLKLCGKLAQNQNFAYAYDELQTIIQTEVPTYSDIFDNDNGEFSSDIVLYKCYRNPREILVCAHALGFGLYGKEIVQMLENEEHWKDIGYNFINGKFEEGSEIVVERPVENSLQIISENQTINDVIITRHFEELDEETNYVAESIKRDIGEGLNPEDILVIVMDDRNAKLYLQDLSSKLGELNIEANNIHSDSFGLRDFQEKGRVTLSTVYKAKGNEAYMVYIIGVDYTFQLDNVQQRNKIFTAITRAKGWVNITGLGDYAKTCAAEVERAKENFPNLIFRYPSRNQLKIMKRDLREAAIAEQEAERQIDRLLSIMTPEQISAYINRRTTKKETARRKKKKR